jgi:hypothetical protein
MFPGANTYSTEVYTERRLRESLVESSQTQRCKLDNLCCRGTAILLQMIRKRPDISGLPRNNFRLHTCVLYLLSRSFRNWNMLQWFPSEYYGNEREGGKNRHFYHVHDAVSYFNPVKRRERLIRFAPLSRCITSFLTGLYCEKDFYYCFFKTCCCSIFKKSLFYYCSYHYHRT